MAAQMAQVGFVGFGEAANAFLDGWRESLSIDACAFDIKAGLAAESAGLKALCAAKRVTCIAEPGDGFASAQLIFCLVTADQAFEAARQWLPYLREGQYWIDGNSCSPGTKRQSAVLLSSARIRYVDMAIMSPVHPNLHRTPLLVSGPWAQDAVSLLSALDMRAELVGSGIGAASTIKMIRSVMIKGMEALTAECLLAARKAGVDDEVLHSLTASDPEMDWRRRGAYNLERMMAHGRRRAAEMREVSVTLRELGLPDRMAAATAEWQHCIGSMGFDAGAADFAGRADRILAAMA
jgi:3-hydroxyisobutyrate dehydrogenase-like beta-hydroxyacid dehydrogenase